MDLSRTTSQLEAAAEPSRLRLMAVLLAGEAAVAELTAVLQQSQPRVSRHLRVLVEAGLVENFREGRWVYYRLTPDALGDGIGHYVASLVREDPLAEADRRRMAAVRRQREREALARPGRGLAADRPGGMSPEALLAEALDEVLGKGPLGDLLDVGTGAGTVLRLLAPRAGRAIGVDIARPMRQLARARLHQAGLSRCSVREADAHGLPFAAGSFDVVVLDEVLRGSERPLAILGEAARVMKSDARLVIIDHILPVARRLPGAGGDGVLFENQVATLLGAAGLRLAQRQWLPGRAPDRAVFAAVADRALQRTGTND